MRTGVSAVLLAAGAGSRFDGDKLLAEYGGRPLIEAALEALSTAPVDEVVVVLGAGAERLRALCERYGARAVENERWREGQSTSVLAGLAACDPASGAAIVALADQPLIGTGAFERLIRAYGGGAEVAVATYEGEARNPVLFSRGVWPLLTEKLSGDTGARGVLRGRPELVTLVACDGVGDPSDVDTKRDLRRLRERRGR